MNLNRRNFLVGSTVASTFAGLDVSAQSKQPAPVPVFRPGKRPYPILPEDPNCGTYPARRFDFSKEPKRVRKSFYDLTDDELKNLFRAVGYMRNGAMQNGWGRDKLSVQSPLQWDNYAQQHALHCNESSARYPQVHWGWNFLPWHRGYIFFLERILANILTTQFQVDGSSFAFPYWDWIHHKEIPNTRVRKELGLASPLWGFDLTQENMVNPDTLGFDNLALFDGYRGPSIAKPEMSPQNELTQDSKDHVEETIFYMGEDYVNYMLSVPFEQFAGRPGIDRSNQGLLEQGPHNDGHDWVGTRIGANRDMGTLRYAALDPIFFMHHANIDRIWSLYRQPQPDPETSGWGKTIYRFTDIDGSDVCVSISDIIKHMNTVEYRRPLEGPSLGELVSPVTFTTVEVGGLDATLTYETPATVEIKDTRLLGRMAEVQCLEIVTRTINNTEKGQINLFVNTPDASIRSSIRSTQCIGRIAFMDGDDRANFRDVDHQFTIPVKNLAGVQLPFRITFVSNLPDTTLVIKSIRFLLGNGSIPQPAPRATEGAPEGAGRPSDSRTEASAPKTSGASFKARLQNPGSGPGVLEKSPDLRDWSPVSTNPPGPIDISVPTTAKGEFFRVVPQK
ncbi:MAG: tyrosinase family protein [Verrucomicrobia bacterium]|nr:tyrosinase family protein [Verrucomicrobiota bacterium]